MDRLVLRFRGQNLTKEQLLDFSARFGELDKAPINVKGEPWIAGYPNLAVMSNIMEKRPARRQPRLWRSGVAYRHVV